MSQHKHIPHKKRFNEAERYYLAAVDKNLAGAMNNLAWHYFKKRRNRKKALALSYNVLKHQPTMHYTHTFAILLLWNQQFNDALTQFETFLSFEGAVEDKQDITLFLLLLIAMKQRHLAYTLMNDPRYELKERFKPVWYALMFLMQKEHPGEYLKRGEELRQTVEEVLEKIQTLQKTYLPAPTDEGNRP